MKSSLADTANEVIQSKKNEIKKPWVTDEVLQLIDERRKFKNRKDEEGIEIYKKLRWKVIRECRKAKEINCNRMVAKLYPMSFEILICLFLYY